MEPFFPCSVGTVQLKLHVFWKKRGVLLFSLPIKIYPPPPTGLILKASIGNETRVFQVVDVNTSLHFSVPSFVSLVFFLPSFSFFLIFFPSFYLFRFYYLGIRQTFWEYVTLTVASFCTNSTHCLFNKRDATRLRSRPQFAHQLSSCVTLTSARLFVQRFKVGYAGPSLTIIFAIASCCRNVSVVEPAT